ncbi:MAG: hypothetical protein JW789_04095 [Candidatus Aenigmarchaeota archaeon]|nr:hypothetical protein [Candidatus Aenigmarchaeota archaeon]
MVTEGTKPKPRNIDSKRDAPFLHAGRYGTDDMINIWGPEKTFEYSLMAQKEAVKTMSDLYPDIVPPEHAMEIYNAANLSVIDPDRIREIEDQTGHDVIAINRSLAEKMSPEAAAHINKGRTSADTTETAKALQIKNSLEVVADSIENLRDIVIEKAIAWSDVPHMDTSHWLDALPTVAGRPLAFNAEMLQSDLDFLAFVYANSIKGKWADATGNHHSSSALGIDGLKLQKEYCRRLGLGNMDANAQIPGKEYLTDVIYAMARTAETMNNLAFYMAWGKGSDAAIFRDGNPKKRKGSSAMPQKDAAGGNPTAEEQVESFANLMRGNLVTSLSSNKFRYARDLSGSASDRDIYNSTFKFGDHSIRRLADAAYWLDLNEGRSVERVKRSFGTTTSQRLMTYLTDRNMTNSPMTREDAHNLMGRLATEAYNEGVEFLDKLYKSEEVMDRFGKEELRGIVDPMTYIGQSKEIIQAIRNNYHGKRTLYK